MSGVKSLSWSRILLPLLLIVCPGAAPAQSTDDLPSAPSAVNQPKPAPKPNEQQSPAPPTQSTSGENQTVDKQPASEPDSSSGASSPSSAGAGSSDVLDEGGVTIPVRVNEVSVVFTVTDKHNHYVKDLTKKDFAVVDNQLPVSNIRSFRRETDLPMQVGLLIDASNSIRDRFKFEQESAIEFLNETIRRRYDRAFVVGFDVSPEVTQDFTDDTNALAHGVRLLRPGGGTAMYDALYYACRDKLMKAPETSSVRRAIILVSDGEDNSSVASLDQVQTRAEQDGVVVYAVGLLSEEESSKVKHARHDLDRLTETTGGVAYYADSLEKIDGVALDLARQIRNQYTIAYTPLNQALDGTYRKLRVEVTGRERLTVRTRAGYRAIQ